MAYTPPYKLKTKAAASTSASAAVEGIGAFLSRIGKARRESDKLDDLEIQERITKGDINMDELIAYNKKKQSRFSQGTPEWQTLQNNMVDLEIGKKWETYAELESSGATLDSQRRFLDEWKSEVKEDSDLYNQHTDSINRLNIKIEDQSYNIAIEESISLINKGKKTQKEHIKFLSAQLASTTNEKLRIKIKANLNTAEETLVRDTERAADATLDALHGNGLIEDEKSYLTGLEEDLEQATTENDILEIQRRTQDIKEQKAYKFDMEKSFEYDEVKLNNAKGTISDEEQLTFYKEYLNEENLDEVIRYGSGAGLPRRAHYEKEMASFIPRMIDNKEDDLRNQFDKTVNSASSSFEDIQDEARAIGLEMDRFAANRDMALYTQDLDNMKASLNETLVDRQLGKIDLMESRGDIEGVETLRQLNNLASKYGDVVNKNIFQSRVLNIEKSVGQSEYNDFYGDTFGEIKKRRDEIAVRENQLNTLLASRPDLGGLLTQEFKSVEDARKGLSTLETDFNKKFGSNFKDFKQFLPDLQTGEVTRPDFAVDEFNFNNIDDIGGTEQLGVKIPDIASLQRQNPDDILDESYGGSRYLKPGAQLK